MSKDAQLRLEVLEPRLLLDGALTAPVIYPLDVPSPAASPQVQVELVDGQPQLFVYGTDAADAISLSQSQGQINVKSGSQVQAVAGTFGLITVETYAGDDVITLEHSFSVPVNVAAGDGNDTVYDASPGADRIDGGAGDDLLVSVGGGADRLAGSGGLDSFWNDSSDTITDSSSAERAAGTVHIISQFAQPYTQTPTMPQYMPMEVAGQKLADPIGKRYRNFADQPLFVNDPTYRDVVQGKGATDCYFLSSLAGYARTDPGAIRQAITSLGDGTYAVRFYRDGQETYYRVDGDLPARGKKLVYAHLAPDGAIWAPLLEKAYAFFRKGLNTYRSLNLGWMTEVYSALTNSRTSSWTVSDRTSQSVYDSLSQNLAAGNNVTAGSKRSARGPIVASHGYTVMSVQTIAGHLYVTVYNPWGRDGRKYDSNPSDGLLQLTIEKFIAKFDRVAVGYA